MPPFWSDYLPQPWNLVAFGATAAAAVFAFISGSAFFAIWAERKVSARMQDRLGPTRVGPFGLLQSLADGIKLISKEDHAPAGADPLLFRLAPYLAFCAAFCGYIALPFGAGLVAQELSVGAFFMLAVLSSEVFGVVLAGYASANKWSLFGGVREAAQVVSYEVPRALCVVVPVCVLGTLNLNTMGNQQAGWFWNWTVFHDPFTFVAFFVFFITATASCKRAPFDLAEAESELVAGFLTEYSGFRWSIFFLAEYGSMFAVSGLAALLFLGGWHTGFLPFEPAAEWGFWWGNLLNLMVFAAKCWGGVLVMMWLRWSLPRLRIDQVMTTCLQYFLPIACALLVGVCLWQLLAPPAVTAATRYVLSVGSLVLLALLAASVLKPPAMSGPAGQLPGAWAGRPLARTRAPVKPYALIAVLWASYFHPLILHPTATLFAPYSDLLAEHLPARVFLVREWRTTGELPLWNPYHFCGSPFVHDVQVGTFYPPYAATFLFPESTAGAVMSWVIALHVLAAGCFAFAYARSNGLGDAGCLVAAVGWMFAGKWMTHLLLAGHTVTIGLAWLPLVLLGLERGARRGGLGPVLGTGAALALLILGTHPQWTFYAGVFAAFWTFPADRPARRRWLLTGAGAVVVALALTAVQLLPTLEAAGLSARTAGLTSTGALEVGVPTLLALAGPGAVYSPPASWEARGLMGLYLLAAALAAPALAPAQARYRARVLAGLVVFSLGGAALVDWLPGFNRFRVPTRMLLIAGFPLAFLAGTATDALARAGWSDAARNILRRRVWLVVGVVAPVSLLWDAVALAQPGAQQWARFSPYWLIAAGLLAPALGVFGGDPRRRTGVWVAVVVAEAYVLLPAVAVAPQVVVYPPTATLEFVASRLEPGAGRATDWDDGTGPADRLTVFGGGSSLPLVRGVETPRGYNPLDVRHYREFIGFVAGDPSPVVGMSPVAQPVLPNFEVAHPPLFDALNVRYLVAPATLRLGTDWQMLASDPGPPLVPPLPPNPPPRLARHVVYERPSAFPRAWVVPEARPMPAGGEYAALVANDFRRAVLLTTDRPLPPAVGSTPTARVVEYRPNRVRVELSGDGGGFLVLADVWYPGWECRVDGVEVPVERANHAFRAVRLPAGAREAVFTFEPRSYRVGWWVSVVSLAVLAAGGAAQFLVPPLRGGTARPPLRGAPRLAPQAPEGSA